VLSRGFSWVVYDENLTDARYLIAGTSGIQPTAETAGNVIDGGAGNDFIGAGWADDIADGGEGDDTVLGMGGADVLFGGVGNDTLNALRTVFIGSAGNDRSFACAA
jgi:Ca2+-binding RTX toxin-like protein